VFFIAALYLFEGRNVHELVSTGWRWRTRSINAQRGIGKRRLWGTGGELVV